MQKMLLLLGCLIVASSTFAKAIEIPKNQWAALQNNKGKTELQIVNPKDGSAKIFDLDVFLAKGSARHETVADDLTLLNFARQTGAVVNISGPTEAGIANSAVAAMNSFDAPTKVYVNQMRDRIKQLRKSLDNCTPHTQESATAAASGTR